MVVLCPQCHLPHSEARTCWHTQAEVIQSLLRNAGDQGNCSGCSSTIYWIRHKNGKRTPYDVSGLNHFISCPKAGQFSTRGKKAES